MRDGNPNLPRNPVAPVVYANSRYAQGRANPMGVGVESNQGGVLQGPKSNVVPGAGANPARMSETLRRFVQQHGKNRVKPPAAFDTLGY